ncbi:hypothetical protein [Paraburkholderia tropica]|uniref:hypothetical protein n=1 Tax=Paraburkholderia tropica TaxID=92647 RepID=UPI001F1DCA77|nr:hypothetical protein [Paraburkholderia tropica]MDE1139567.1 hypothetical protein [Paraburkholderia tropica]
MAAPKWTEEEDALLRKVWGEPAPLKTVLDQFPLRSLAALVARGRDMKLPDRRRAMPAERTKQTSWARLRAVLQSRRATIAQLAGLAICSQPTVRRFIRANRAEMRIARYLPPGEDGRPTAVWAWGAGEDARRPAPKSANEIAARYYRKLKRERPEVLDKIRARARVRHADRVGRLVRRDPAVAAMFGSAGA